MKNRLIIVSIIIILIPTLIIEIITIPLTLYILFGLNYFSKDPYIIRIFSYFLEKEGHETSKRNFWQEGY